MAFLDKACEKVNNRNLTNKPSLRMAEQKPDKMFQLAPESFFLNNFSAVKEAIFKILFIEAVQDYFSIGSKSVS